VGWDRDGLATRHRKAGVTDQRSRFHFSYIRCLWLGALMKKILHAVVVAVLMATGLIGIYCGVEYAFVFLLLGILIALGLV